MRSKIFRTGLVGLASAAIIATPVALAAQASAIDTRTANCSDGDSDGTGTTWFTKSGNSNQVNFYEALLTNENGLGNKNNVDIQHKKNNSFGGDDIVDQQGSSLVVPNQVVRFNAGSRAVSPVGQGHTRFEFTFDNSLADDNCNVDTADF